MMNRLQWLGDLPMWTVPAAAFLLLLALELVSPLRARGHGRRRRWTVNIALTAVVFAITGLLLTPLAGGILELVRNTEWGLVHWLGLPLLPSLVIGFLLMDLTFYWWHRANHEIPLLWRLHNVHHVDPEMDTTTSFRFHGGEILLSIGFRAVQIGLLGITPLCYAVYELCFTLNTMFHHSNVRLPAGVERALNWVIVTPRMHGIHHSAWREETNSNYSSVFRLWDTLHRSARLNVPQSAVEVGVPGYAGPEDNSVGSLLAMPFRAQRDYWRSGDEPRIDRRLAVGGGPERLAD